jgi:hypothetical protein
MTRAMNRPSIQNEDHDDAWEHIGGEAPDSATQNALNLAHQAAAKFPELEDRYKSFAGKAVIVSGVLVALAGVAVAQRMRRGQGAAEILDEITPEEIELAATATSRHNRAWRLIRRVARRRADVDAAGTADTA